MSGLARYWGERVGYAYDHAYAKWRRDLLAWQVRRLTAACQILGTEPAEVTEGDLLWLAIDGQIASEATMPELRVDGRYGPRRAAQLATRAVHQVACKAEAGTPEP